ncbi:protein PIN-LIKES 6-like isoform X5 [Quercus robur]|nr:protein PIN-LIKES 6-like isoform X5 [Quercus robur]
MTPLQTPLMGWPGVQGIPTTPIVKRVIRLDVPVDKYPSARLAKVFTMCFLGFLMASKYVNILPASGRKLLNGLVFPLLLPCLIFSQLGQAITIEKMLEWWFIWTMWFCKRV